MGEAMLYYSRQAIMKLDVVLAPALLARDRFEGWLFAVIDVLRATSTVVTAVASGAHAVYPCLTAEEAASEAALCSRDDALTGGEDMGRHIAGFDLGNSPLEYLDTPRVGGKSIYFYTTNGSGAIRKAYDASGRPVVIAALLNLSAASSAMLDAASRQRPEGMAVLCSGRYGGLSAEDLLCAGLMVEKCTRGLKASGIEYELLDTASVALGFAEANTGRLLQVLSESEHGKFLKSLGFEKDLAFTAQLDLCSVAPFFDGKRVTLSRDPRAEP